ncbi:hypothetical protein [Actinoplanes cyaneus]|uniref:hypothetical protein n=1 Tax=Actinoplanes cyaneus TaxID=52696 RepID=UPI00194570D1|nr:hypothetical protein [Actinoplanes cyaneus]
MRTFGIVLAALGLGTFVGARSGESLTIPAVVAGGLGLLLLIFGRRDSGKDLIPAQGTTPAEKPEKPVFSQLGTRVEGILELAEEQAADHVAEARREGARIIAEAEAEANRRRSPGS